MSLAVRLNKVYGYDGYHVKTSYIVSHRYNPLKVCYFSGLPLFPWPALLRCLQWLHYLGWLGYGYHGHIDENYIYVRMFGWFAMGSIFIVVTIVVVVTKVTLVTLPTSVHFVMFIMAPCLHSL
jgi:hypothetical protein